MLDENTLRVYQEIVINPSREPSDLARVLELTTDSVVDAIEQLRSLQLLVDGGSSQTLFGPASPRLTLGRLVKDAETELARRAELVKDLRSAFDTVVAHDDARREHGNFVVHASVEAVRERLVELSQGARSECLSLNPGRVHRADSMEASKPLNEEALARGVEIRSIYQESFVHDAETLAYGQWLEEHGAQVRTVPLVTRRLIIIDRHVAIVPIKQEQHADGVAIEVAAPAVIEVLLDHFDNLWAGARPFAHRPQRPEPDGIDPLHRQLLQLLSQGHTDEMAARQLGLSDRTVRRLMAGLMRELGATSRLQAGVEAVRRGWL